jgi:hypothetical protein
MNGELMARAHQIWITMGAAAPAAAAENQALTA